MDPQAQARLLEQIKSLIDRRARLSIRTQTMKARKAAALASAGMADEAKALKNDVTATDAALISAMETAQVNVVNFGDKSLAIVYTVTPTVAERSVAIANLATLLGCEMNKAEDVYQRAIESGGSTTKKKLEDRQRPISALTL